MLDALKNINIRFPGYIEDDLNYEFFDFLAKLVGSTVDEIVSENILI